MVLEADGYQPYLISPEKGLRALVRKVLELAKDPGRQCVDEVSSIIYPILDESIKAICALCTTSSSSSYALSYALQLIWELIMVH